MVVGWGVVTHLLEPAAGCVLEPLVQRLKVAVAPLHPVGGSLTAQLHPNPAGQGRYAGRHSATQPRQAAPQGVAFADPAPSPAPTHAPSTPCSPQPPPCSHLYTTQSRPAELYSSNDTTRAAATSGPAGAPPRRLLSRRRRGPDPAPSPGPGPAGPSASTLGARSGGALDPRPPSSSCSAASSPSQGTSARLAAAAPPPPAAAAPAVRSAADQQRTTPSACHSAGPSTPLPLCSSLQGPPHRMAAHSRVRHSGKRWTECGAGRVRGNRGGRGGGVGSGVSWNCRAHQAHPPGHVCCAQPAAGRSLASVALPRAGGCAGVNPGSTAGKQGGQGWGWECSDGQAGCHC
jgi:hypothetical protein